MTSHTDIPDPPRGSQVDDLMTMRNATLLDAPDIADVHHASRAAALRDIVPADLLGIMTLEERRARWEEWLADPRWVTIVAEVGGRIVGFGTLGPSRDDDADPELVAEMPTLYVHPSSWRRGIGRRLCDEVVSRAADLGYRELTLWTLEANRGARLFYASLGFAADGVSKKDDDPVPTDLIAVRLRMDLT
ncbi:MAG: GNAT family N-acetyltransferase [Gemmatimonadetes bacterium]|nr:GNAT family N-acetyltransferase [Gemmatimonadota bacterium]